MPELPEVETICRGLQSVMEGQRIIKAQPMREGLRFPFPPDFSSRLTGKKVLTLKRRAKCILCELEDGETLLLHLGMSGKILVYPAARNQHNKHDHIIWSFDNGMEIAFNDARRFGIADLIDTGHLAHHPLLSHLGPEPLSVVFTPDYLYEKLHTSTVAIKNRLMDSRIVVGIGNIYASEALSRAGISPLRSSLNVSKSECRKLIPAIQAVLEEAIASGGSTLRDYVRSTGDVGSFQHQFNVYGKTKEPCVKCSTPIKRIIQMGRSSFFCPVCQK